MSDTDNTHRKDRKRNSRWWLDPALARLAFDASDRTQPCDRPGRDSAWLQRDGTLQIDLDDPAQREFGDYELLERIGQGGMGVVYRARQRNLDREVAIKLLSAGPDAPEDLVETMRSEAHHAAVLQHPNIVIVHELGEYAGLVYYAMQLVPGRSLSQRLETEGIFQAHAAARIMRALAEAVDYAHRLGVLHLDLKPGNILIDEREQPLIADFGLARKLEQVLVNEHVQGTPSYMAPEQARTNGPPLSPATDQWALGAVLYEMLTGRPPFADEDPAEVLRALREEEVRKPSQIAPVPADLEAICMTCLEKDPARRYPDTGKLVDDLGRFLDDRPVVVRRLNSAQRLGRWMRREPMLATVIALAFVILVLGLVATIVLWRYGADSLRAAHARQSITWCGSPKAKTSTGTAANTDRAPRDAPSCGRDLG